MKLSVAGVIAALAVAGCVTWPHYEPGKSAVDIPANIKVIRLDKAASVTTTLLLDDLDKEVDPAPSQNDREVLAVAKAAVIAEFENSGMHIVEEDSRAPALRINVYVGYQAENGLSRRAVMVMIQVLDAHQTPILKGGSQRITQGGMVPGLISAALEARDTMVTSVARKAVQDTVVELQKGTKPVAKPTS